MADAIDSDLDQSITTDNLVIAYSRLLALFDLYRIPATFAFVMAFLLPPANYRHFEDLFCDVEVDGNNWLKHFRRQLRECHFEGWFAPEVLDLVMDAHIHEIGCHGFCHLPLGAPNLAMTHVQAELSSARAVAKSLGLEPVTFVFPRNSIAHTSVLENYGYIGFRGRLARSPGIFNLPGVDELNLFSPSQDHSTPSSIIELPSGYFLNWRHGLRRFVPHSLTVYRWRRIVDDAIASNGVAHLWLHPHNIITAPQTYDLLVDILSYVARERDKGNIAILTQRQYCERLKGID